MKLKWKFFWSIWFFIFITHKYHILQMHTTHSLLLEFLRNLIRIAICLKMLYHQSRCENFNVLLFLRKCRFQWGPCFRCFVMRNCDTSWVNLKPITLSNCYQTQKTSSLENSKNECKNMHYYNDCKNMNELWMLTCYTTSRTVLITSLLRHNN